MFDRDGYECAQIDPTCFAAPLCEVDCNTICSFMDLLPYGSAWQVRHDGLARDDSLCEPFSPCDPCEPVFVRNFIRTMARQYERIRKNSAWAIAQLNPLTAPDRSYWLKKFGLTGFTSYKGAAECPTPAGCVDCFCPTTAECSPSDSLLAAIEYGLIRAAVMTRHPDFVPSMTNLNYVLANLGYMVQRSTKPPVKPCPDPFLAYNADPECGDLPALASNEDGSVEECAGISYDVRLPQCDQGFATDSCSNCEKVRMRLVLVPVADYLTPAPGDPCDPFAKGHLNPEDDGLLCATLDCDKGVYALCTSTLGCPPGVTKLTRPAAAYAAELLRRIWPVYQPMEIVEIKQ